MRVKQPKTIATLEWSAKETRVFSPTSVGFVEPIVMRIALSFSAEVRVEIRLHAASVLYAGSVENNTDVDINLRDPFISVIVDIYTCIKNERISRYKSRNLNNKSLALLS